MTELNRLNESESMELNGRASALEVRVRQQLNDARENSAACSAEYEAELNKYVLTKIPTP